MRRYTSSLTWTYDDLYRLTGQLKAGQVCTYTLDGVGNLKTMWEGGNFPKTFTFNAADRLVTMLEGASLTTYAYTGYGALESEITGNKATTYAYSGQDQLVGTLDASGTRSTYTFDGDGLRRTAQEGNVQPTTMVWDGGDYLLLRGPTSDQVVLSLESEIVHCGGKDLLTDPLGTLVKEISPGASLSSLFQFYPYGTPLPTGTRTTNPFRFVGAHGYYTDTDARDYVRARELVNKLGRWMQADPLWPEERSYKYAKSCASSLVDPTGLRPQIAQERWGSPMGQNFGDCGVFICAEKTFGFPFGWIDTHRYVCVTGPYGGCTAGLYPSGGGISPGSIGNRTDPCNSRTEPYRVDCRKVSSDCGLAQQVCGCVKQTIIDPGYYIFPIRTCYTYPREVIQCACRHLPMLGFREDICLEFSMVYIVA